MKNDCIHYKTKPYNACTKQGCYGHHCSEYKSINEVESVAEVVETEEDTCKSITLTKTELKYLIKLLENNNICEYCCEDTCEGCEGNVALDKIQDKLNLIQEGENDE